MSRYGNTYTPEGIHFLDVASGRDMLLVADDCDRQDVAGWILYWNPNYQNWVTLRKATEKDRAAITAAIKKVEDFHGVQRADSLPVSSVAEGPTEAHTTPSAPTT